MSAHESEVWELPNFLDFVAVAITSIKSQLNTSSWISEKYGNEIKIMNVLLYIQFLYQKLEAHLCEIVLSIKAQDYSSNYLKGSKVLLKDLKGRYVEIKSMLFIHKYSTLVVVLRTQGKIAMGHHYGFKVQI